MASLKAKFRGGYSFKRFRGKPAADVATYPLPAKASFLFEKKDAKSFVKKRQEISIGEPLAEGPSATLYSTVKGTVSEIKSIKINHQDFYFFSIDIDQQDSQEFKIAKAPDFSSASIIQCLEAAHLSGIAKLKEYLAQQEAVKAVIVHHTEADVFSPSLESLLNHLPKSALASGANMLQSLFPEASLYLGVDRSKTGVLGSSGQNTSAYSIRGLSSKYPQAMDAPLGAMVLGASINDVNTALDQGIFILSLQDLGAMVQAVETGQYPLNRLVALSGPAMDNPRHVVLRIGTPLSEIFEVKKGVRYIENSLLSGSQIDPEHFGVTKETENIIAVPEGPESEFMSFARPGLVKDSIVPVFVASFLPVSKRAETNIHGEHRACLNCGYCSDVCPAGIMPQMLHRYIEREMITESLVQYKLFDCIECGLCSYVCPSKIDLAAILNRGKFLMIEEGVAPEKLQKEGAEK